MNKSEQSMMDENLKPEKRGEEMKKAEESIEEKSNWIGLCECGCLKEECEQFIKSEIATAVKGRTSFIYKGLEKLGRTHAYFLGEKSSLSHIFCFEKDGDFSGIIYSKKSDDENALRGLTLVLAQQIENQDFIFEFIKK